MTLTVRNCGNATWDRHTLVPAWVKALHRSSTMANSCWFATTQGNQRFMFWMPNPVRPFGNKIEMKGMPGPRLA